MAGALLAVTGAAPEHWIAKVLEDIHLPRGVAPEGLAGVDYRLLAVVVGLSIIVGDTIWRNHWRREPVIVTGLPVAAAPTAPEVEAAPLRALRIHHAGQKVGFC